MGQAPPLIGCLGCECSEDPLTVSAQPLRALCAWLVLTELFGFVLFLS